MLEEGTCEAAQPIGVALGVMLGIDQVLQNNQREPLFSPFLFAIFKDIFPEKINSLEHKIKAGFKQLAQNEDERKTYEAWLEYLNNKYPKSELGAGELSEIEKEINKNQKDLFKYNLDIESKVITELQNLRERQRIENSAILKELAKSKTEK